MITGYKQPQQQPKEIKPKDIEKAATFLEKVAKALRSLLSIFR